MNTFDLQIQSTASDGKYSPRELVRKAGELGLTTIALTDHDTVGGLAEAFRAGQDFGVEVIPGIEFSCHHKNLGLHILGYGIDIANQQLLASLEKIRVSRISRAREMVRRLKEQGFSVEYENVERRALGGIVGRPHIVDEILGNPANRERLGGIQTMSDFIRAHLVRGKPAYVESNDFNSQEAVNLIQQAGGAAVWSHPAVHFAETLEGLEAVLKELVIFGLDGVEVFNPSHTESAVKFLFDLSERYKLIRTAGSDFHREPAPGIPGDGGATLGDFATHGLSTVDILPKLKARMARQSR